MTTIWAQAFWNPHEDERAPVLADLGPDLKPMLLALVMLCGLSLILGFFPQPFITLAQDAANQLLAPASYVAAVLGEPAS
jgi:multicomponent Na+:H+ antiporter subunit D